MVKDDSMFFVSATFSLFTLVFCSVMLGKHEEPTYYLPVMSGVVAFWLPAPKYRGDTLPSLFMRRVTKSRRGSSPDETSPDETSPDETSRPSSDGSGETSPDETSRPSSDGSGDGDDGAVDVVVVVAGDANPKQKNDGSD